MEIIELIATTFAAYTDLPSRPRRLVEIGKMPRGR
jgi:hypothetical protein